MTKRTQGYAKADDTTLLPLIRKLIDKRSSYGYRRITALLNHQFEKEGKPRVNHEHVYRIMKQNKILLPIYDKKPMLVN